MVLQYLCATGSNNVCATKIVSSMSGTLTTLTQRFNTFISCGQPQFSSPLFIASITARMRLSDPSLLFKSQRLDKRSKPFCSVPLHSVDDVVWTKAGGSRIASRFFLTVGYKPSLAYSAVLVVIVYTHNWLERTWPYHGINQQWKMHHFNNGILFVGMTK